MDILSRWRRALLALIPAILVASPALAFVSTDPPGLSDPSEPGSIIVYQKFQRGFVTVDAGLPAQSVQPRSLIELGATCPKDDANCGVDNKVVRVNFHWVCPPQPDTAGAQFANPSGGICNENDFFVDVTVNGKVWFSPEGGVTSGDLPGQIVPQAPCGRGYLIGYVTNIGKLVGGTPAIVPVFDIEACYFCANNFGGLGVIDGPTFLIRNTGNTSLTNLVFSADIGGATQDSFAVGTIAAGGSVIIEPGVSQDGGAHSGFFTFLGNALDTSEVGPEGDNIKFELTGLRNGQVVDTGIFTAGQTAGPSTDGSVAHINFLGGPGNADAPCGDCFGPKAIATFNLTTPGFTTVFENNDAPIRFDGLIGDAIMRNTPQDLQAFRAVTIQADPNTAEEAPLTGDGSGGPNSTGVGRLVLNGGAGNYDAVTGQLTGDVRYDSDLNPPFADTALILLTLDIAANQVNQPTFVNLNFFNARQQSFSEALSFICWGQINISTIDASLTQEGIGSARGLFQTTQAFNSAQTLATCPDGSVGCVTLLGAVQVTEGPTPGPANATRSYTVPVFDNSLPIPTCLLTQPPFGSCPTTVITCSSFTSC